MSEVWNLFLLPQTLAEDSSDESNFQLKQYQKFAAMMD